MENVCVSCRADYTLDIMCDYCWVMYYSGMEERSSIVSSIVSGDSIPDTRDPWGG